jgi:Ring finger domain
MTQSQRCSFCREQGHNIRGCRCNAAVWLHGFINERLFDMNEQEQTETLNAHPVSDLRMMSVILSLKMFPTKSELIDSIVQCVCRSQRLVAAILSLQRAANRTNKVVVNTSLLEESRVGETLECPICWNSHTIDNVFTTNCNHSFCLECMKQHLKTDVECKCPMCRTKVVALDLKQLSSDVEILGQQEYSL